MHIAQINNNDQLSVNRCHVQVLTILINRAIVVSIQQHGYIPYKWNSYFCARSGNHSFTCRLFSSVIMQLVPHSGLGAECFAFGKHLIHAVNITLVTLADDVSLVINKSVYTGYKNHQPFLGWLEKHSQQ
jgi:hypothetical protein